MDHGTRGELLSRLAEAVGSVAISHPTRVAIDGPPAGKHSAEGCYHDSIDFDALHRFEKTLDRARTRDLAKCGSVAEVERRFRNRYLPSQQFYFDTVRPTDHADIIVHNDEPGRPAWETRAPRDHQGIWPGLSTIAASSSAIQPRT